MTKQFEHLNKILLPETSYTLVPINSLKAHDKNAKSHPKAQIERLAKIIDSVGFRLPIIVSKLSGQIVKGHGTWAALKHLNWSHAPVHLQDFKDEAEEYSFLISENAIQEWGILDLAQINNDFHELGPDFDMELLGLKDFNLDFEPATEDEQGKLDQTEIKIYQCPHCEMKFELNDAERVE